MNCVGDLREPPCLFCDDDCLKGRDSRGGSRVRPLQEAVVSSTGEHVQEYARASRNPTQGLTTYFDVHHDHGTAGSYTNQLLPVSSNVRVTFAQSATLDVLLSPFCCRARRRPSLLDSSTTQSSAPLHGRCVPPQVGARPKVTYLPQSYTGRRDRRCSSSRRVVVPPPPVSLPPRHAPIFL